MSARRHRAFPAAQGGAAAIEFAMVSMPFLALVGAILQIAYVIWVGQNFDRTVQNAARSLFTGQFQIANNGTKDPNLLLEALRTTMCGAGPTRRVTLFDCSSVKLDVSVANSFGVSTSANPIDTASKTWSSTFGTRYTCARPGAIVIVTAAVKVPVLFSLLNLTQTTFADGAHLIQSTAVFRTEPYQTAGSTGC